MNNININEIFLKHFNYDKKDNYEWKIKSISKDIIFKKAVFWGKCKINNKDDYIFVKQFELYEENIEECKNILKEIYFLVLLNEQNLFVKIYDILLSENHLFLIFKDDEIDLKQLILNGFNNETKSHYLSDKDLVKIIIYKIALGLYFLHSNSIIHNDIKISNVLIDSTAEIKICDFGSAVYKGEISNEYTMHYAPPEFLLAKIIRDEKSISLEKLIRDEKSDMWALGAIMVELYLIKDGFFKLGRNEEDNELDKKQLFFILSKFGLPIIPIEILQKLLKDTNLNYKIDFDFLSILSINDKDAIELINNLLTLNPEKRYTAEQVLNSNYFKNSQKIDFKYKNEKFNEFHKEMRKIYDNISKIGNKAQFLYIFNELISKLKRIQTYK